MEENHLFSFEIGIHRLKHRLEDEVSVSLFIHLRNIYLLSTFVTSSKKRKEKEEILRVSGSFAEMKSSLPNKSFVNSYTEIRLSYHREHAKKKTKQHKKQ